MATPPPFLGLLLLLFLHLFSYVAEADNSTSLKTAAPNPFTAKAALIRYWNRKVPNGRPQPDFLVSKLSPLSALDTASFSSLAASGGGAALSPRLPALCSAARLLCSPSLFSSTASHPSDFPFAAYSNSNFSNYSTDHAGDFSSYAHEVNVPNLKFTNYDADADADASGRVQTFSGYSDDTNSGDQSFAGYGKSGNGIPLITWSFNPTVPPRPP